MRLNKVKLQWIEKMVIYFFILCERKKSFVLLAQTICMDDPYGLICSVQYMCLDPTRMICKAFYNFSHPNSVHTVNIDCKVMVPFAQISLHIDLFKQNATPKMDINNDMPNVNIKC